MNAPMANLPVVIFQFAMSPYDGLAAARLGGRAADHPGRAGAEHSGAHAVPAEIDACAEADSNAKTATMDNRIESSQDRPSRRGRRRRAEEGRSAI